MLLRVKTSTNFEEMSVRSLFWKDNVFSIVLADDERIRKTSVRQSSVYFFEFVEAKEIERNLFDESNNRLDENSQSKTIRAQKRS